PGTVAMPGVHTLRSVNDCLALRQRLDGAREVLVVGAGFVGCEVAASLRDLGLGVHLVEPQSTPLAAALGETLGELVARWHRKAGVDLRCGAGVARLEPSGRRLRATLTDGAEDRKSTRLNSSHVKISYAVFCLKKKTSPSAA